MAQREFGPLDVVVSNVGNTIAHPFTIASEQTFSPVQAFPSLKMFEIDGVTESAIRSADLQSL